MDTPFSLKGKQILVTGASSGIGRTIAIECSKMGATIIITGRNLDALKETLTLMDNSNMHSYIVADLANQEDCDNLIKQLPQLDGFVNNAGINKMLPLQFYKKEILQDIFDVNCFVPMLLMKGLIKSKKFKKPASVVFTSSIGGTYNYVKTNGMYGASKAALTSYVKYAALELSSKRIRCNSIHPGMVETPMINSSSITVEDKEKDIENYPLGRYGRTEDIAYAAIYLLSDASSWVTGSEFVIDGGRSLI